MPRTAPIRRCRAARVSTASVAATSMASMTRSIPFPALWRSCRIIAASAGCTPGAPPAIRRPATSTSRPSIPSASFLAPSPQWKSRTTGSGRSPSIWAASRKPGSPPMLQYLLDLFRIKRALAPSERMPVGLGIMAKPAAKQFLEHRFGDGREEDIDLAEIRRARVIQNKRRKALERLAYDSGDLQSVEHMTKICAGALAPSERMPVGLGIMAKPVAKQFLEHRFGDGREEDIDLAEIRRELDKADLNNGKTYYLPNFGDELPKLFPQAKDGDTITVRNNFGWMNYRFIKDRWYDCGFTPAPKFRCREIANNDAGC